MSLLRFSTYPFLFRLHVLLYGVVVAFLIVESSIIQGSLHPSVLIVPSLWACILAAHWFYAAQAKADKRAAEQLDHRDIDPLEDGLLNYEAVGQKVEAELAWEKIRRRGRFFRLNVAAYIVFMLLAWLVVPATLGPFLTASSFYSIALFSVMGLSQLALHYFSIQLDSRQGDAELRERLIGRAVQRAMDEKAKVKAKRGMRLSDDGELLDIGDDLPDEKYKRASGQL